MGRQKQQELETTATLTTLMMMARAKAKRTRLLPPQVETVTAVIQTRGSKKVLVDGQGGKRKEMGQ